MSDETSREFVDSNILVYSSDSSAGVKKDVADQLLTRLWDQRSGSLSVQVLQEFYVAVTTKVPTPMAMEAAIDRIRDWSLWHVFSPKPVDVIAAIRLADQSSLSFWDAMIVHAASESGCAILWTEDLSDSQTIRGVQIRNPFDDR